MDTITRKLDELGRVVLPRPHREALDWHSGAELSLRLEGDRIILTGPAPGRKPTGSVTAIMNELGMVRIPMEYSAALDIPFGWPVNISLKDRAITIKKGSADD